jgi:hypothetical protein
VVAHEAQATSEVQLKSPVFSNKLTTSRLSSRPIFFPAEPKLEAVGEKYPPKDFRSFK